MNHAERTQATRIQQTNATSSRQTAISRQAGLRLQMVEVPAGLSGQGRECAVPNLSAKEHRHRGQRG